MPVCLAESSPMQRVAGGPAVICGQIAKLAAYLCKEPCGLAVLVFFFWLAHALHGGPGAWCSSERPPAPCLFWPLAQDTHNPHSDRENKQPRPMLLGARGRHGPRGLVVRGPERVFPFPLFQEQQA